MSLKDSIQALLPPQARVVYDHLNTAGSITRVEAEAVYRIRQIPTAIYALRAAGVAIRTEFKKDRTGQRYGRYTLGATQ